MVIMRCALIVSFLFAAAALGAERSPQWVIPLRDAVYEQRLSVGEIRSLYLEAISIAERSLSGAPLYRELSRIEFFMGRAMEFEGLRRQARAHYEEGLRLAERAVAISPCEYGWTLRAKNLAFLIPMRGMAFAVVNGMDVERFAAQALALDPKKAPAQYLIAGRWLFAPRGFSNIPRGISMMEAILTDGDPGRSDRFNIYSAIGRGLVRQRKYADAILWFDRALDIFPTNRVVREQLALAEASAVGL